MFFSDALLLYFRCSSSVLQRLSDQINLLLQKPNFRFQRISIKTIKNISSSKSHFDSNKMQQFEKFAGNRRPFMPKWHMSHMIWVIGGPRPETCKVAGDMLHIICRIRIRQFEKLTKLTWCEFWQLFSFFYIRSW